MAYVVMLWGPDEPGPIAGTEEHPLVTTAIESVGLGVADATVRVEFEFIDGTEQRAVSALLRFQDSANYWAAQMDGNDLSLKIRSNVVGLFNDVAVARYALQANARYAIVFQVLGNVFTASYYQMIDGSDLLLVPSSGSNPQTFDATATGSDRDRLTHGMSQRSILGVMPVRVYRFEGKETPIPVDATVTVPASGSVISRLTPAVSFVENPPVYTTAGWGAMKPNLLRAVGAVKTHIFPFGLLDPWLSNSSGKAEAVPNQWEKGNRLPLMLDKIREIDANMPIILTLYGGCWWMKQTLFNNAIANLTSAQAYDDSGRIKYSELPNFLIMVDQAVRMAAKKGCRTFEVWNELKGWYDVYPHVGQTWDVSMNPGNTTSNPVMGFSYFYQQVVNQVVATMTSLGFLPSSYTIGGPYIILPSQNVPNTGSIGSDHPMYQYGSSWGYMHKAPDNALKTFLSNVRANGMRLDTLLLDVSTVNTDEGKNAYVSSDPFALTKKFDNILTYVRGLLATYGLDPDMAIDFSEIYYTPQPALRTIYSAELRMALAADTLVWCALQRVRYPIMWGPTGANTGGVGGSLGAIVAADGWLQGPGLVAQFFKDNFGPGQALYPLVCDTGLLGGLATATKMVVYNKTADDITANVAGEIMNFTRNETKLLTR